MSKYLIISCLLLIASKGKSQSSACDSIYNYIETNQRALTDKEMIDLFEKVLPICIKENKAHITSKCLISLSHLYYYQDDLKKFEEVLNQEQVLLENNPELPKDQTVYYLNNKAILEKTKGNFLSANKLLLKAIEIEKNNNNEFYILGDNYYNLSRNYSVIGDYKNSLKYSLKSDELKEKHNNYKDNNEYLYETANSNFQVGNKYLNLSNYNKSSFHYEKAYRKLENYSPKSSKKFIRLNIKILNGLIENSIEKKDFKSADKYLSECKKLQQNTEYWKYRRLEHEANMAKLQGKCDDANDLIIESIQKALTYFKPNKSVEIKARIHLNAAKIKLCVDSIDSSLRYLQKALQFYDKNLKEELSSNPNADILQGQSYAMQILKLKSELLNQKYKNTNDIEYLKLSDYTYTTTSQLLDDMRLSYLNDESKFYISNEANEIYEDYLSVLSEMYSIGIKKEETLNKIFNTIENNKSNILFESLSSKLNLLTSQVPSNLIENENQLRTDISFYQKLLNQEKQNENSNKEKIKSLEDKLFDLNEAYSILNSKLETGYQKYYDRKSSLGKTINIQNVQSKLNSGDLVIEYFQNDSTLYAVSISKEHIDFHRAKADFQNKITNFFSAISQKPKSEDQRLLEELSNEIPDLIINPILEKHENINHIIVIPDGQVSKVPFEIYKENENYLIEKYAFTYLYSINQLFNKKENLTKPFNVLSIIPDFSNNKNESQACSPNQLIELPFSSHESNSLKSNFSTDVLNGEKANTELFLDKFSNYDIIHLATHACLNTQDPSLSEIHFADKYLTNYDLENLNATPELVILSACNTGQGEVKRGEGMISLSRGFFEAGVKSLQSSLWNLNDQSTSEIMSSMFKYLKEGENRSDAMRLAKLEYLKSADKAHKHPYYWAGFIHIGEFHPLINKDNNLVILALISALVISLLFYWWSKKKRHKMTL